MFQPQSKKQTVWQVPTDIKKSLTTDEDLMKLWRDNYAELQRSSSSEDERVNESDIATIATDATRNKKRTRSGPLSDTTNMSKQRARRNV